MWIILESYGAFLDYSHLWIMHEIKNWRRFERKNVPRGTLLWNGNPQYLVSVDNYFLKNPENQPAGGRSAARREERIIFI
jgi:hypothetical protein